MNPKLARWTRVTIALYLAAVSGLAFLSLNDESWLASLMALTLPGSSLALLWTWSTIHGGGEAPHLLIALLSAVANAFGVWAIAAILSRLASRRTRPSAPASPRASRRSA